MILPQHVLKGGKKRRVIARPETRESFIIGKIQWQRELCRCVQMDLNIGLQKNAESLAQK
ncbi:hypothetical protein KoxyNG13_010700 [Klebsiella pasteurii]